MGQDMNVCLPDNKAKVTSTANTSDFSKRKKISHLEKDNFFVCLFLRACVLGMN